MARLDEWLLDAKDTRWVFVTGGPGMGKSAILAAWLARREAGGSAKIGPAGTIATTLVPHHFIRRQVADWDQPEVIAASLAAQIAAAVSSEMAASPCGHAPRATYSSSDTRMPKSARRSLTRSCVEIQPV